MYELGYQNNNCIACVKGGASYFLKIKKDFPSYFDRMVELENKIGATCIKNKPLKDLKPGDGKNMPPITPNCGTFCEIEFADIIDENTDKVLAGYKTIKQLKLF